MNYKEQDMAVIGVAIRFPQANTLEKFWEDLKGGRNFIDNLSSERLRDINKYCEMTFQPILEDIPKGAFLNHIDEFDYEFFHINKREACYMDPAQRLFLETAYHCFEDAGYMGKSLCGSYTGVFVGYGGDFEFRKLINHFDSNNEITHSTGILTSFITSRISYMFDLKGPAMTIDTSCSSSLVALYSACKAIENGECEMALVGGAQIYTLPMPNGEIGVRSPEYVTKSYDDRANGTGSGEGICAILIKKAKEAVAAGDHIYAIIKGGAINCDGQSAGLTCPNMCAQRDVITAAWINAGVSPDTITYLEGHGTGTRLGDPIELLAISEAFRKYTKAKAFCAVSSVKSNLGHLGYCAGLAGIVKAILQLKHQTIVQTVHYTKLNHNVDLSESAIYVSCKTMKWDAGDSGIRRCGISSFGISGTNCHIIMEEYCDKKRKMPSENHLFIISADTEDSLRKMAEYIREYLVKSEEVLGDICYTLSVGREHKGYRMAIVATSEEDLLQKLSAVVSKEDIAKSRDIFLSQYIISDSKVENTPEIRNAYSTEELREYAKKYVCGINYVWNNLYYRGDYRRISLPGREFRKERCWLENSQSVSKQCECSDKIPLEYFQKCATLISHDHCSYIEAVITILFKHYLGLEVIYKDMNLYEIGGDSIIALSILESINYIFQINIKAEEYLAYQTVEEVTNLINEHLHK